MKRQLFALAVTVALVGGAFAPAMAGHPGPAPSGDSSTEISKSFNEKTVKNETEIEESFNTKTETETKTVTSDFGNTDTDIDDSFNSKTENESEIDDSFNTKTVKNDSKIDDSFNSKTENESKIDDSFNSKVTKNDNDIDDSFNTKTETETKTVTSDFGNTDTDIDDSFNTKTDTETTTITKSESIGNVDTSCSFNDNTYNDQENFGNSYKDDHSINTDISGSVFQLGSGNIATDGNVLAGDGVLGNLTNSVFGDGNVMKDVEVGVIGDVECSQISNSANTMVTGDNINLINLGVSADK
jgi:hypothetical protein